MGKCKVVIDSTVYIVAAINPSQASGYVIKLASQKKISVVISEYIKNEVKGNLKKKRRLTERIRHGKNITRIYPQVITPPINLISLHGNFIRKKDAPVLALAEHCQADYLITLDRRDFLNNPNLEALGLSVQIIKPGDFLKIISENLL